MSKFQQLLPRRLPHLHLQLQQLQQVDVDGDHHVEGHDAHVDDRDGFVRELQNFLSL